MLESGLPDGCDERTQGRLRGGCGYAGAMVQASKLRGFRQQNAPVARRSGGELALIERIRRRAGVPSGRELRLGIGDDCAILRPRPGEEIVVTTDFSLEGRHFRRDWHSPESVGHRTLARGLSDLAAMGARPVAAFLSLALPRAVARDERWIEGFLDGLLGLAARAGVPLGGGDTSEAPGEQVLADIVLLGAVPAGKALLRSGAKAGDRLFCTGMLGGAAAELRLLAKLPDRFRGAAPAGDEHPHLFPEPRLAAGQALRRRGLATAAIDLSDGLSTDLRRLCDASGLAAEVDGARLPVHALAATAGDEEALRLALNGGEDYELLFTVRSGARVPRRLGGVVLTEIGRMLKSQRGRPTVTLLDAHGKRTGMKAAGWEHLR